MKYLTASMVAALLYAGTAVAQTQGANPPDAQPPGVTLVTGNEARHSREADARHCLDLKDNNAIIRCAERYRYRYGRQTAPGGN